MGLGINSLAQAARDREAALLAERQADRRRLAAAENQLAEYWNAPFPEPQPPSDPDWVDPAEEAST